MRFGAVMLVVIGTSLVGGLPVGGASAEAAPPRVIVSVYPWDVPGTPYLPDPSVPRPDVLGTTVDAAADGTWVATFATAEWPGFDAEGDTTPGPALPGTYSVQAICVFPAGTTEFEPELFEITAAAVPALPEHGRIAPITIDPVAGPVGTVLEVRGADCPGHPGTRIGYNIGLLEPAIFPAEHPLVTGGWQDVDLDGSWRVDLDTSTWNGYDDQGFPTSPPPLAGRYQAGVDCYRVDATGVHFLFSYAGVAFDLVTDDAAESPRAIARPDDATVELATDVINVGAVLEMSGRGCLTSQVAPPTTTTTMTTTTTPSAPATQVAPAQPEPAIFTG